MACERALALALAWPGLPAYVVVAVAQRCAHLTRRQPQLAVETACALGPPRATDHGHASPRLDTWGARITPHFRASSCAGETTTRVVTVQ